MVDHPLCRGRQLGLRILGQQRAERLLGVVVVLELLGVDEPDHELRLRADVAVGVLVEQLPVGRDALIRGAEGLRFVEHLARRTPRRQESTDRGRIRDHALVVDREPQSDGVPVEAEEPLEVTSHDSHVSNRDDAGHLLPPPEVGVLSLDPVLSRWAEDVEVIDILERKRLVGHV